MKEKMYVKEAFDRVVDERTFLNFLAVLSEDFANERAKENTSSSKAYGPGANGWENSTIDQFLESAAAWGEDTLNRPDFYPFPDNVWKRCANIIYAGKFYE